MSFICFRGTTPRQKEYITKKRDEVNRAKIYISSFQKKKAEVELTPETHEPFSMTPQTHLGSQLFLSSSSFPNWTEWIEFTSFFPGLPRSQNDQLTVIVAFSQVNKLMDLT